MLDGKQRLILPNIYFEKLFKFFHLLNVFFVILPFKSTIGIFCLSKFGNLLKGCKTAGPHFNTYKKNIHGGPNSKIKHNGDLGNIKTTKKITSGTKIISTKVLNLNPCNKNSIIGRSIIVHKDKDDLGKGGNMESLKTGNAGARLACGVIGLS